MNPRLLVVPSLAVLAACESNPDVRLASPTPAPAPPFVAYSNPAHQALEVDPDGALIVVFSTSMNPATVTEGNLVLSSGSTIIDTTVSYSGFTARISPAAPLPAPAPFQLSIANSIESTSGLTLSSSYAIGFTTGNPYPAFSVQKSDTQSILTSSTVVTWNVVQVDDMGADPVYGWGPQPNAYVVPITGWWLFSVSLAVDADAGDRLFVSAGSAYLSQTHADTAAALTGGGTVLVHLTQGTPISVVAAAGGTASPVNSDASYNRFQGQLVRR